MMKSKKFFVLLQVKNNIIMYIWQRKRPQRPLKRRQHR